MRFAKKEATLSENSTVVTDTTTQVLNENEESHDPNSILDVKNIKVGVDVNSRDEALKYLANMAVENNLATDSEKVFDSYITREKEGSTGMTDGFAIPHAQSAVINKSAMLVLKLEHPIDWRSLDGKQTEIVISFLIPQVDSNEHLKYLSNTAKLLTHEDFIAGLKSAKTPEEIKALFATE
ncbi:PTS sugar transporter subunit IIA [Lactobacillus sp. ESL0684]|uniref:PTS sugar transporter subunit IIA n=1 Tax=Lactobacillus sp. ESL0684 TaxID=2983213 RepID=UPI0023F92EAA|nr:PTS sugar transporter subunit IIA [Lactobacillus sp. ESL0684]WEV43330.1 PTS sugar transporter subunit IIA [Lactobacillus sp. ESL0684]